MPPIPLPEAPVSPAPRSGGRSRVESERVTVVCPSRPPTLTPLAAQALLRVLRLLDAADGTQKDTAA